MQVTPEIAGQHYAEHKEKPFFGELVDFITSGMYSQWYGKVKV